MNGSARTDITATADEVYALVSDVTRYGEWSPENRGGVWLDPATSAVPGARFRGDNKRVLPWKTTCTVTEATPGRCFAFSVGDDETTWRYDIEPLDGGVRLTESYEVHRPPGRVGRWLTWLGTGVRWSDRSADLERAMAATLQGIKATAEGTSLA